MKKSEKDEIEMIQKIEIPNVVGMTEEKARKEKEDNSCDEMLNTISYQKSIGTR